MSWHCELGMNGDANAGGAGFSLAKVWHDGSQIIEFNPLDLFPARETPWKSFKEGSENHFLSFSNVLLANFGIQQSSDARL